MVAPVQSQTHSQRFGWEINYALLCFTGGSYGIQFFNNMVKTLSNDVTTKLNHATHLVCYFAAQFVHSRAGFCNLLRSIDHIRGVFEWSFPPG